MIICGINVDDVTRSHIDGGSRFDICNNNVKHASFVGDDEVKARFLILPSLRSRLDCGIALQHSQHTVLRIFGFVFLSQILDHEFIGSRSEIIDVGAVGRLTGDFDLGAYTKALDTQFTVPPQQSVSLHTAIDIRLTYTSHRDLGRGFDFR